MYFLLALLNFLTPKAAGSRRAARGVHYGPNARQTLDIYTPKAAAGAGPWPVIYFLYGGSWNQGERGYYEFAGRSLAAAGHVVIVADYRLVPEIEYPVFLEDCAQGFAWALEHARDYGGDPDRMVLMGHSAGAYNAVMILLAGRFLSAMGLAARVKAVVGLSGPYDFYPFDVPASIRAFGAAADPKSTQPVNLVRPGLPPMLLISGAADTLVYPRNTVALSAKLSEAGCVVEEKHYAGIGHTGTLLALGALGERRAPILRDIAAFVRAHL